DETDRFVRVWSLGFAAEAILDPIVTGPLLGLLGAVAAPLATYAMIPFVLLGDFRVFLLLFLVEPGTDLRLAIGGALGLTIFVPARAWLGPFALEAVFAAMPPTTIWIVYESAFACLALVLRARWFADGYRRAILAYAAVYYALWATADVIILAGIDV